MSDNLVDFKKLLKEAEFEVQFIVHQLGVIRELSDSKLQRDKIDILIKSIKGKK